MGECFRRRFLPARLRPNLARDPLRSVRRKQFRAKPQAVVPLHQPERSHRRVAGAADCPGKGPFRPYGAVGGLVIDSGEQCAGRLVIGPAFNGDGGLPGGRQEECRIDWLTLFDAKPIESSRGKEGRLHLTRGDAIEPSRNIAADADCLKVGPAPEQLGGAARRGSTDPRALADRLQRGRTDQPVADIGARQAGGNDQRIRSLAFDILAAVDGGARHALQEREVEFLGPQRLAADLGQGTILDPVTAGADLVQDDAACRPAMRRFERKGGLAGLGERERGSAGSKEKARSHRVRPLVQGGALRQRAPLMSLILGLESSCDDSAAALVTSDRRIVAQRVVGQNSAHAPFGGVVPEIAARAHVEVLPGLVADVLAEAGVGIGDVDAIAATAGPGLIGGVMVGLLTAKGLALAAGKPLIAVNHLEGHALSPRLVDENLDFPYLLLLVSGGHCQLLEVRDIGDYRRLATTIDDAAGEAFDKSAKLLGLPYPGGPAIEALAAEGDVKAVPLPRPLVGSGEPHFSFAGLKSAVQRAVASGNHAPADVAASFQQAVIDCLVDRTRLALHSSDAPTLVVAGGVAANGAIRTALAELARIEERGFSVPPGWLCTDNAAMIAWAGAERFGRGIVDGLDAPARARWPLDHRAEAVRGAGVKA